jgi:PPOX class probable F420-dependent enzyme
MTQAMGGGVNQRAQIRMSDAEIADFLHGRHSMTMCTLNPDGSIHAVAMWYGFVGDKIAFETKRKSQKIKNLQRDPRITCLVEDGETYEELRGVSIVGTASIVEDPDLVWEAGVSVFERYQGTYTEEMKPFVEVMLHNRYVVTVDPVKTVSWDHRKLGLPPTNPTA